MYSRQYYFELCNASLDKLFLRDEDVRKYRGAMPPTFDVLNQLAKGLEFIHSSKLFHCDIKPQNVLIRMNPKNEEASMKWADFGLSKRAHEKRTCTTSEVTGTCHKWLGPELLKFLDNSQTVKSEVFAEGLVFSYYLMDGQHPKLVVTLENFTISVDRTDTLTNQNSKSIYTFNYI
jgi:serine/threonine protein kinase